MHRPPDRGPRGGVPAKVGSLVHASRAGRSAQQQIERPAHVLGEIVWRDCRVGLRRTYVRCAPSIIRRSARKDGRQGVDDQLDLPVGIGEVDMGLEEVVHQLAHLLGRRLGERLRVVEQHHVLLRPAHLGETAGQLLELLRDRTYVDAGLPAALGDRLEHGGQLRLQARREFRTLQQRNDGGVGFAPVDQRVTGLRAVRAQLHEVVEERHGDVLEQGLRGLEAVGGLLAPQFPQLARHVLADRRVVLVVPRQRGGLVEALGVPVRKLALDHTPQRRRLQMGVDGLGGAAAKARQRRDIEALAVGDGRGARRCRQRGHELAQPLGMDIGQGPGPGEGGEEQQDCGNTQGAEPAPALRIVEIGAVGRVGGSRLRLSGHRPLPRRHRARCGRAAARRKHEHGWPPVREAFAPDQVVRLQVPLLDELGQLRLGDRAVLLTVPGDVPLRFCGWP